MYPQWSTLLRGVWRCNNSSWRFESERNVVILPMMTNVKERRIFLSSLPSHLFEKYNNNASQKRLSKLDLPQRCFFSPKILKHIEFRRPNAN